jgi:uncharacterized protein DUF1707/2TM domain-containing protein
VHRQATVVRAPRGEVRASDADRESAAARLKAHYTAGRLSHEELEERLDAAYALFADLPWDRGARLAVMHRTAVRAHALSYGVVNSALVATWALTDNADFWPAWSIFPWGAGLALHAAAGSPRVWRMLTPKRRRRW